jgi:hypothetical protein
VNEASAAARRGLRGLGVLGCAAVMLLSAGAAPASRTAGPLVKVTPRQLYLSQPVDGLAADNGRAAFAFCRQLVGVWKPGAANVTRLGPLNRWTCPPPSSAENLLTLAIARDRIAWAVDAGGIQINDYLLLGTLARPHTLTVVANVNTCCHGEPDPERMGDVFADRNFVVFSTRLRCGDFGAPACPAGTTNPPIFSQTIWHVRRPPFSATCADRPGICKQLVAVAVAGAVDPLDVDTGHVVAREANGTLIVWDFNGSFVQTFTAGVGTSPAAELMGNNRLVMLVPGHVLVFNIVTGLKVRDRPVPAGSIGGVCGIPPCPAADLRLVDAARGLVLYTLAGKLHLLRLRDGRDVRAARVDVTDARFGDTGLFYAFKTAGPWQGHIRFVPWRQLVLRP